VANARLAARWAGCLGRTTPTPRRCARAADVKIGNAAAPWRQTERLINRTSGARDGADGARGEACASAVRRRVMEEGAFDPTV
jgi:hypothetical protein